MSKRILNIYLYQEGDELQIRLINIHPWTRIESIGQILYLKPDTKDEAGLLHFVGACCDLHNISSKGPFWNNIKLRPQQGGFEIYENQAQYILDLQTQSTLPVYQYQDMLMTLSQTDEKTLFMLLLALDPTIYSFCDAPSEHEEYQITLFKQKPMPDFLNPSDILIQAINKEDKLGKSIEAKQSLSPQVAKWIMSQSSNQALKTTLERLLASGPAAFMLAIQEKMYPQPIIEEFIRENCIEGSVMSALFNPEIPHARAEKMLKKELKSRTNSLNDYESEQTLTEWCHEFEGLQWMLWKQMVQTVIAKPAIDGGFYSHGHTEIELLKVTEFGMSKNGNIILMFNKTQIYKEYYDVGQLNYNIIEQELRFVCNWMGLHFLPDQDFHAESVAFDEESTTYLMNRGFHITPDFVKSLIKESTHTPRLFKSHDNQETKSNTDSTRPMPF